MTGTISVLSIIFMSISCLVGIAIPVVLFLYFRFKKRADILPFFVGCGVMLVFALILESAVHRLVLSTTAGAAILGSNVLYALYGGIMAGLFEETGRFLAFRTVLKRSRDKDVNALMYGAGHGGFEAAAVLGITMINNIVWSVMINSGNISKLTETVSQDTLPQVNAAIQQLYSMAPYEFLLGSVERIFAVTLQIALSVLVWFAAKCRKRLYLYPIAILIHFAMDSCTVLLQRAGVPSVMLEMIVGVLAVAAAVFVKAVWKQESKS